MDNCWKGHQLSGILFYCRIWSKASHPQLSILVLVQPHKSALTALVSQNPQILTWTRLHCKNLVLVGVRPNRSVPIASLQKKSKKYMRPVLGRQVSMQRLRVNQQFKHSQRLNCSKSRRNLPSRCKNMNRKHRMRLKYCKRRHKNRTKLANKWNTIKDKPKWWLLSLLKQ